MDVLYNGAATIMLEVILSAGKYLHFAVPILIQDFDVRGRVS